MLGLEVESVVDRGKILAPFAIAEVVSAAASKCRQTAAVQGQYRCW